MAERTDLTLRGESETDEDLSRSAEEIRQDIAVRRAAISTTVDRLGDKVEQAFDWRTYVSDYPIVALGVAAGAGLIVSRVFKPRPTPGQRVLEALAYGVEDATWKLRDGLTEVTGKKRGVGAAVKAAATAWITKGLTDYLKARLTGTADSEHPESQSLDRKREQSPDLKRVAHPDRTISSIV